MKKIAASALLLLSICASAQKISSTRWQDLFSYNNVLCIREDNGKLIAATENGIFYYTPTTGEITKLSKANGLHEVKITAFDYNPETRTGLVGYANGSMDVISPEGITYVVDVPIATSYNGTKKINHISITGNQAVISVNYGVSIFNLDKKEFGDTAFFVTGNLYEAATEAVIKNKTVFAITPLGIKKHDIDVKFPIYSDWQLIPNGSGVFKNIDIDGNKIAYSTANQVWSGDGNSFSSLGTFSNIKDITVTAKNVVVTSEKEIAVVETGQPIIFNADDILNTAWYNNEIFAGTTTRGILKNGKEFRPDGPYSNQSYRISLLNDQIWISTGGKISYNEPAYYGSMGYYHFNGKNWIYPDFFINNPKYFNIMDVTPDPAKPADVFFSNFTFDSEGRGIYKMTDDKFVRVYANGGSGPYNRPNGISFDENNQMFVGVSLLENSTLGTGYYIYNRGSDSFQLVPVANVGGVQKPFFADGFLFLPAPYYGSGGLIIKNYKSNNPALGIVQTENNLPVNGVVDAALDNSGDLWIGTRAGLRVLSNPTKIVTDPSIQSEPIVITQNGIPEELFRESEILNIEVDGGNQKWVSVAGGGVYYLSADGQRTLLHFTKENSPLPDNSVTDIKIDKTNGKVYFVTLSGVMVYHSDISEVSSDFGEVLVYPNPVVSANYSGNVHFKGLAEKTNIRIVDAAGNLVHQAVARGGVYEWDLTNKGKRVASGIYFVLMTNAEGTDKATAKIAVVN